MNMPGQPEFVALMNCFTDAILLYDQEREIIIQANSAFINLTQFATNDVVGKPVEAFLDNHQVQRLIQGEEVDGMLYRRMMPTLPVVLDAKPLDVTSRSWLISVVPLEQARSNVRRILEQLFNLQPSLAELYGGQDITTSLELVGKITKNLLGVSHVSVYRAQSDQPSLREVSWAGLDRVFPAEIPASDLIRLADGQVWSPGKRITTHIHRAARTASLVFTGAVPLGEKGLFGLLVVGDRDRALDGYGIKLLEGLGKFFNSALSFTINMNTLRERNRVLEDADQIGGELLANSRSGIIIVRQNRLIEAINHTAQAILGYESWEVQGQPIENVLIGSECLVTELSKAMKGIGDGNILTCSFHRRDGQAFPAELQIVPVMRDSHLLAIIVMVTDISENVQIQSHTQQLESRAELGEITAMFAHEVRNPINNISAGLQLLSSRLRDDDANLEVINKVLNDCSRLDHLMESVLAFSKPMDHVFQSIDMTLLLQRLMERYRPRFGRYNITPYFHSEDDCGHVNGDTGALERVFINLFNNAIDAMQEKGGTLAVRLSNNKKVPGHPQLEITVTDNGPGIPDEMREKIFKPFETTKEKGTGLGLAISQRIITAHQGSITLTSFPGGTVFHVLLPVILEKE